MSLVAGWCSGKNSQQTDHYQQQQTNKMYRNKMKFTHFLSKLCANGLNSHTITQYSIHTRIPNSHLLDFSFHSFGSQTYILP